MKYLIYLMLLFLIVITVGCSQNATPAVSNYTIDNTSFNSPLLKTFLNKATYDNAYDVHFVYSFSGNSGGDDVNVTYHVINESVVSCAGTVESSTYSPTYSVNASNCSISSTKNLRIASDILESVRAANLSSTYVPAGNNSCFELADNSTRARICFDDQNRLLGFSFTLIGPYPPFYSWRIKYS